MTKFEEKKELLTRLGLTNNQATILVTLEKIGEPATVNTISKMSGVTREKIYCVIPKLLELALVEKILDSPIKFNAVSLKKATSILLRKLDEETSEIKNVTKALLESPDKEDLEQNIDDETIVVCNKEVGYTKRMHEFEKATQQLDIITIGFDLELAWSFFLKKYCKILKRGAKIRLILQEHIKSEKILKELKILKENPLFDFRYAKSVSPAMSLYVIDGKQVTIATSIKNFPRNYSVICTRAPVLVALTLGYFENLWKKSSSPNIKTVIAQENLVR
jgi:sugar-specific transcriptional regulator TrmB